MEGTETTICLTEIYLKESRFRGNETPLVGVRTLKARPSNRQQSEH